MTGVSSRHHRRSIRLPEYDYTSPGVYFATICVRERLCLLGDVIEGVMRLSAWGEIVHACWCAIPDHFPHVSLDAFVIMPNHVHGILVFHAEAIVQQAGTRTDVGAQHAAPLPPHARDSTGRRPGVAAGSLGAVVRSFKAAAARQVYAAPDPPDKPFWQRNYYEHIVRDEPDLDRIRTYIDANPARWANDSLYPAVTSQHTREEQP